MGERRVNPLWRCCLLIGVLSFSWTASATLPTDVESGDVVLRVVPPRILSIQDGSRLFASGDAADPHGYGRPGASGFILISGIGLAGASGIEFDGGGIRGEVISAGAPGELNPSVLVRVTIEETAHLGPRSFTLITPRGPVRSGDVAFVITEPKILAISDEEGSPGSHGRVDILGIGLDQTQAIEFEGSGVSGTILPPGGDFQFLNPVVEADLRIAEEASFGERAFALETPRGRIESGRVRFRVVAPRIEALWEGHNFRPGEGFRTSGEGARDSFGDVLIFGIGLGGATDVTFSGEGIEARLLPGFPEQQRELNPVLTVHVTIAPEAPLGDRGVVVTLPRALGQVDSRDAGVTFTVVEPRVDGLADRWGFNEAVAGACGEVEIRGVGIREATEIAFSEPGGVRGLLRPAGAGAPLLNAPVRVWLAVDPQAAVGPRTFSLKTRRGEVSSREVVFVVSWPRIVRLSAEAGFSSLPFGMQRAWAKRASLERLSSVEGEWKDAHRILLLLRREEFRAGRLAQAISLGDEVAPGSAGEALILGVGLMGVESVRFSGGGVTARARAAPSGELNPAVPVALEIEEEAPLGERAFTLTLGLPSGSCR